jgi:hypothetical protein
VTIEVEIKEIKEILGELSKKLDALVLDQETLAIMITSQHSLKDFLVGEPDLYSTKDLKVAYR